MSRWHKTREVTSLGQMILTISFPFPHWQYCYCSCDCINDDCESCECCQDIILIVVWRTSLSMLFRQATRFLFLFHKTVLWVKQWRQYLLTFFYLPLYTSSLVALPPLLSLRWRSSPTWCPVVVFHFLCFFLIRAPEFRQRIICTKAMTNNSHAPKFETLHRSSPCILTCFSF